MSIGIPYFRFSPFMSEDIELDEKDNKTLVDLMWNTMVYILTKKEELMQLRDILCE
jgi:calcium-independent phospholipase A2